jgi:3-deoxy-D-manno-octulosonic-acid transferase
MHFLYSLLTAVALALLTPYFLVRGVREGKYLHSLRERFGFLPRELGTNHTQPRGAIWVHAVSVGELLAGVPLARALQERFPGHRLLVSTTTRTARELARQRCAFADGIFYFPLDWAWVVRRVFGALRPELVVILETELWPNFLRQARRAAVPVVFVNGRISKHSQARALRLARWCPPLRTFYRRVLDDGTLYLMQSEVDAERLRGLGAPGERVHVTGNLKFDFEPPQPSAFVGWLEQQLAQQQRHPLLVAGSVVAGEEDSVLEAYAHVRRRWPRALLVLAPRKPERFADAAELVTRCGYAVLRRSRIGTADALGDAVDVLLLDSVGELAALYRLADVVFVGGSLVPAGGHNILEPAWFGRVPIFGPSLDNFRAVADAFLQEGAALCVSDAAQLGQVWVELLADGARRERLGQAARTLLERNRGATLRVLERITDVLAAQAVRR